MKKFILKNELLHRHVIFVTTLETVCDLSLFVTLYFSVLSIYFPETNVCFYHIISYRYTKL